MTGFDSPLCPSRFEHSPGIGFDKKSLFLFRDGELLINIEEDNCPNDDFIGKELTPSKIACQFLIEGGEKSNYF
jgi:hypothetical protein